MILRGALLLVSLFADIDSGKKATPVVAIRICKICGQAPLESFACKIQVIINSFGHQEKKEIEFISPSNHAEP